MHDKIFVICACLTSLECFWALSMIWFIYQNFISFWGQIIFHFMYVAYFVYPFPCCFHLLAVMNHTAVSLSVSTVLTKCHRLGVHKQEKCIAHRPRGWKSRIRVPGWAGESFLLGSKRLAVTSPGGRGGSTVDWLSFKRAHIPFMRYNSHDLIAFQRPHWHHR